MKSYCESQPDLAAIKRRRNGQIGSRKSSHPWRVMLLPRNQKESVAQHDIVPNQQTQKEVVKPPSFAKPVLAGWLLLACLCWPMPRLDAQTKQEGWMVILSACARCHGPTENKLPVRMGGGKASLPGNLDLSTPEGICKGGKSGPAVVPGKPEESRVWWAVIGKEGHVHMPPFYPLRQQQIDAIEQWLLKMGKNCK